MRIADKVNLTGAQWLAALMMPLALASSACGRSSGQKTAEGVEIAQIAEFDVSGSTRTLTWNQNGAQLARVAAYDYVDSYTSLTIYDTKTWRPVAQEVKIGTGRSTNWPQPIFVDHGRILITPPYGYSNCLHTIGDVCADKQPTVFSLWNAANGRFIRTTEIEQNENQNVKRLVAQSYDDNTNSIVLAYSGQNQNIALGRFDDSEKYSDLKWSSIDLEISDISFDESASKLLAVGYRANLTKVPENRSTFGNFVEVSGQRNQAVDASMHDLLWGGFSKSFGIVVGTTGDTFITANERNSRLPHQLSQNDRQPVQMWDNHGKIIAIYRDPKNFRSDQHSSSWNQGKGFIAFANYYEPNDGCIRRVDINFISIPALKSIGRWTLPIESVQGALGNLLNSCVSWDRITTKWSKDGNFIAVSTTKKIYILSVR